MTSIADTSSLMDKAAVSDRFGRAAPSYDAHAGLQQERGDGEHGGEANRRLGDEQRERAGLLLRAKRALLRFTCTFSSERCHTSK